MRDEDPTLYTPVPSWDRGLSDPVDLGANDVIAYEPTIAESEDGPASGVRLPGSGEYPHAHARLRRSEERRLRSAESTRLSRPSPKGSYALSPSGDDDALSLEPTRLARRASGWPGEEIVHSEVAGRPRLGASATPATGALFSELPAPESSYTAAKRARAGSHPPRFHAPYDVANDRAELVKAIVLGGLIFGLTAVIAFAVIWSLF